VYLLMRGPPTAYNKRIGNTNPVKMGRCIKELERIYGIEKGNNGSSSAIIAEPKTQKDLADELGISERTLRGYKSLTTTIPEIQELIETNKINYKAL